MQKHAAEKTGLALGTPVIAGTIDAAAEAVSVGVAAPGDMMLMYGSTIFIIMVTETRVRDRACGTRRGSSRADTPRWRGLRPAAR